MRFLADENFPRVAISALRAAGHDVAWIAESARGAADSAVLSQAQREFRLLLTFDKDFGELAGQLRLDSGGILLFRVPPPRTEASVQQFVELITGRDDWAGHFSVIEPGRIRMRPLPI